MVYSRLVRRIRALEVNSFAEYCELLRSPKAEDEMPHLVNAITTNLTSFFREGHHFDHLKENVLFPMMENGERRLRIWSCACSAGMEPYSIAMTMKSAIPDLARWDAKILATDIDSNMINTGIKGEYSNAEFKNIPAEYREYVSENKKNDTISVAQNLRPLVAFKQLNLIEEWPMKGPFDAIFCRNVTIYFDKPTKEVLFDRIADMLKPNGWLYIGHSENLNGISDRFRLEGRTIYHKIK
jgi:chemotaxis protein methyltransferase CheR